MNMARHALRAIRDVTKSDPARRLLWGVEGANTHLTSAGVYRGSAVVEDRCVDRLQLAARTAWCFFGHAVG